MQAQLKARTARIADILTLASRIWGVPEQVITSRSRFAEHCEPRFACCLVAHEHHHSYPMIARIMGYKEHTGVLHGVRRAPEMAARDDLFAVRLAELRVRVAGCEPFNPTMRELAPLVLEPPVAVEAPSPPPPIIITQKPRNVFVLSAETEPNWVAARASIRMGSTALAKALREARA